MDQVIHTSEGELKYQDPFIEVGTTFVLEKVDAHSGLDRYYLGEKFTVDEKSVDLTKRRRREKELGENEGISRAEVVYGYNAKLGYVYMQPSCVKVDD